MKNHWLRRGVMAVTLPGLILAPALGGSVSADNGNDGDADGNGDTHTFAIMGTTDIHAHVMSYDYMADEVDESFGLTKVASIVEEQREKYEQSILIDNGDILQGSILGDLEAVVDPQERNIIIDAMEAIGYDAAAIGNHEFNFGLGFLDDIIEQSAFPWLNANVKNVDDGEPRYTPYVIEEMEIGGEMLDVGMIGFVPPQIMTWDRTHLEGVVEVDEIVDAAEAYVPQMKEDGADIVVAIAHSGIDASEDASADASWHLTNVDGIDAVLSGHNHNLFPEEDYHDLPGVDAEEGTINGVPVVMPGSWGSHLGMIELELMHDETDGWSIDSGRSFNIASEDYEERADIVELVKDRHEATIAYVNGAVGDTETDLNTFFARLLDNEVGELVNAAQLHYATSYFEGTEYEDLPLLSAAAPFRAGRHGPTYFTDVQDDIAIKDIADLYIYPNTVQVVKVDGDDLKRWLEYSAGNFFEIDPTDTGDQMIADYDFRGYNFDTIDGVTYQIDITKPQGERIVNLSYDGEAVSSDEEYLVVTNNYRAGGGGGHIAGADSAEIVYQSSMENREVIIDYIREEEVLNVEKDWNWTLVPFDHEGDLLYKTSPAALDYLERNGGYDFVTYEETDADGWAVFSFDMEAYRAALDLDEEPEVPAEPEEPSEPADPEPAPERPSFTDFTSDDYGYMEVRAMVDADLILGYPDETFRPKSNITRADAAVMMARAFDLELDGTASFSDVDPERYYAEAVAATEAAGIFSGYGDTFRPDQHISRGEVAAIMNRAFSLRPGPATPFTDVADHIFEADIQALYGSSITTGVTETTFGTMQPITRQDFALMLYRAMNP